MKTRMTFFVFLMVFSTAASADSRASLNMVFSHSYNIGNSIKAVANNFNIKETWFVDSKSICRHLGIIKGATDAIHTTFVFDQELKQKASFSDLEGSLAVLRTHVKDTTSFCGRNYASEGAYDSRLEGNLTFIKEKTQQLSDDYDKFWTEFRRVDACLNQGNCR